MDGKGKQKVRIFGLFLGVMVLIAGICFGRTIRQQENLKQQEQEIFVIYPEKAEALQENISYYHNKLVQDDFLCMLAVILVIIGFGFTLCVLNKIHNEKLRKQTESELDYIYEQLAGLQNGKQEIEPFSEETDSQKFESVCDKLKELGCDISIMRNRLREEENSTKALITDISHQLKTPLASIRMCHELVESSDLSEEERRSFMDSETRKIHKMEALLDELVKLSRLENSMIQIKTEPCSLKNTIREAVSQVYSKAGAKNIEIDVVMMEEDIQLLCDKQWTAEAFANIIENAIKYSEANASIHIRVDTLVSSVLIQIEDEGIGIPEGEVNEIFKRFYRGSNAREMTKEGAGVGLYLARSIIEQQGGTIVAKRKSTRGTIFKITLPL